MKQIETGPVLALDGKAGIIGVMIGALVTVVIFAALAPVVANQVAAADLTNFTNGSGALFGLTTLFFVILGIGIIIKLIR